MWRPAVTKSIASWKFVGASPFARNGVAAGATVGPVGHVAKCVEQPLAGEFRQQCIERRPCKRSARRANAEPMRTPCPAPGRTPEAEASAWNFLPALDDIRCQNMKAELSEIGRHYEAGPNQRITTSPSAPPSTREPWAAAAAAAAISGCRRRGQPMRSCHHRQRLQRPTPCRRHRRPRQCRCRRRHS